MDIFCVQGGRLTPKLVFLIDQVWVRIPFCHLRERNYSAYGLQCKSLISARWSRNEYSKYLRVGIRERRRKTVTVVACYSMPTLLMYPKVSFLGSSIVTFSASERLLACVNPHVYREIGFRFRWVFAHTTLEGFVWIPDSFSTGFPDATAVSIVGSCVVVGFLGCHVPQCDLRGRESIIL